MREYNRNQGLYFCHVPRTGGAVLSAMIQEMIGTEHHLVGFFKTPGPGQVAQAHYDQTLGLGVVELHPEAQQFVTVLRDPFDRMVSWYFYLKNLWHGEVDFCARQKLRLADYGGCLEGFLELYPADQGRFLPSRVHGISRLPGVLDQFVFVCIRHRLYATACFLAEVFGAKRPKPRSGNPCGKKDEPVTDEMRADFRAAHAADYEIYDYAVETWKPIWDVYEGSIT